MSKTLIYQLTLPELQVLKEYLEDGEKQGTLQWSKAPSACSFFFIDKKDGKLRPVVDYRPLNEITKKNAAPISLIPKLVVTAALTATPSSDLGTQVESYRDEQEVLEVGLCRLQHSQAARSKRKGTEIHKRLRMRNTDENVAYLYPYELG